MNPEEQLRVYEQDKNAEANIRQIITDAYGGLKPEIEQVRYFENEAMPSFYNTFNGYGTGTSGSDLSPSQILQMASRNVANATTTGQVARDAFDIRRAGMEDLIGSGMRQWNTGYDMANNAYQRWWAQKQHEDQMALAREQMRRSVGSPSINVPTTDETGKPLSPDEITALIRQAKQLEQIEYDKTAIPARIAERNALPGVNVGNQINNTLDKWNSPLLNKLFR